MKKFKQIFVLFIVVPLLLASCQRTYYTVNNVYVENPTDTEYLVCLDKTCYYEDDSNVYCGVLPHTPRQIIYTYLTINETDNFYGGLAHFCLWIYDRVDSVYVKIDSEELLLGPCPYGRVEDDYSQHKNNIVIGNMYFTINDSLLIRMTKNTQLTDSIFGF